MTSMYAKRNLSSKLLKALRQQISPEQLSAYCRLQLKIGRHAWCEDTRYETGFSKPQTAENEM